MYLTHLHFDHTAGIIDLPKDIPYIVGRNEVYTNFRFFFQTDHLAELDHLYEIDFSKGIDLPPFGKAVDLFGDGSFWAISSSGHTEGHVMYFINGIKEKVLFAGDACNTQLQFDKGVGTGTYSSNIEQSQKVVASMKEFKKQYPEVEIVFGHDE